MKKKILSILLMMAMIVSMFPASAFAGTVDNSYTPGTYTGEAQGLKGKVNVSVTLAEDNGNVVISDITATRGSETESYWNMAIGILDKIKANNGTDNVDAKTGATVSTQAIIDATEKALAKAVSDFTGGTGTEADPYTVSSEAGLRYIQQQVSDGNSFAGQYIKLTSDVTLTGEWIPIGSSASLAFAGHFDGAGHTVRNMTITDSTLGYAGFFGYILSGASVRNVTLENASISMSNAGQSVYAGSLIAFMKVDTKGNEVSIVDNCYASGNIDVSAADKVTVAGGLVGFSNQRAAVTNCGTNVTINADSGTGRATAGGLVAWTSILSLFMNDYSLGDITVTTSNKTYNCAGSIFGTLNGIIYNCYTTGNVTFVGEELKDPAGAFAGNLAAASYVDSCYYSGSDTPFGKVSGKYNEDTVLKKTSEELGSEAFAQLMHDNLSSAALAAMTEKTKVANITGCSDFAAMTARVDNKFYDWAVKNGTVSLTNSLWTTGEIDESIFASGKGTAEEPYIIATEKQLRDFAGSLNDKIDYTNKFVALGDDITLSSDEWKPVGRSDYLFNGTFDGQGHTVSGMTLGSAEKPFALDKENLYIGFFGVLGPQSVVKKLNLTDVAFYTTFGATAYVGGIAGVMQGSRTNNNFTGAVIDGCSVSGNLSLKGDKGNQFVGGIAGMQYKGAVINSVAKVDASGVVLAGDLAEVGGLVGLNNRGLVANCRSDSTIYGSGSRENGNEGMAVASNLVACNAGILVNCCGSGNVTTKEHSVYAGMVSGWVTGIGKSYSCWYNLDSTMVVGAETDNPLTVNPVESIGTKVASGVNDEGDAYTGGLVDRMTGYNSASYSALADKMNETFAAFPADITAYGLDNNALKNWAYTDGTVTFGDTNAAVNYVQPDCEKVEKPELKLNDGTWYGRDNDKKSVVKITVKDGEVATEAISGAESGESFDAAVEKAKYKATYGDFSHYEKADPGRFAGGSGTAEDPYRISNEAQLRYLSYSINADVNWSDTYFVQTADITLTGGDWQPIGWALNGEVNGKKTQVCAYPFKGNFDGGNYTIRGLAIGTETNPADQMTSGLFGLTAGTLNTNEKITESDKVVRLSNIHLENIDINAATRYETYTGGLVGSGQTGIFIDNCSVTGKINVTTSESFARAGGLGASVLRGAVTNSWADVDINAVTDTNHVYAGGLYGMDNRVTTINCYALGNIKGNSTNNNKVHIGGLAGQAGGIHINCYATGDVVSLKTTADVGILSGRSGGITIDYNCYYNSEAVLKQGGTVVSPVKGIGVITTNATAINVEGKTKAELSGSEFAVLLNRNITDSNMKEIFAAVDDVLAAQAGRDFVQQNYYEGNKLSGWTVKNGAVTFGENQSQPSVPAVPPAAEDDVKTTTDSTTSETTTSTTVKDTKTETVKNEQGQDISKVTATVSEKVAEKLIDAAVSNKSDTVEITVKSNAGNKVEQTELEIPKKAVESIAKDTNADLVITTDNGQVTLDNKALETIAAETEGDTVKITVNENTQLKEAQKSAADAIGKNGHIFDLKAYVGDKLLHNFRDGKAHVTLPMPEKLKGKDVVVIYINDKGICEILNHTMETVGAEKYIKFTTSHFSTFAVVEKAAAEKIIEQQNADKINSLIKEAKLKATTSKTSKKNVKIKVSVKNNNSLIKEAKAMGYTVKYKFYRSTKKASKYKAVKTKTSNSLISTKGKKGTRYYYKARVLVYDGKKLIAQTELKQCSYGARTWNK